MEFLPIEILNHICSFLDIKSCIAFFGTSKIIKNNIDYSMKKQWKLQGINSLIRNANLMGIKYLVKSEYSQLGITTNDNYAIKWAKLCLVLSENWIQKEREIFNYRIERQNIVNYLVSQGSDPNAELNIKCKEHDYNDQISYDFSVKLRPINIDHVNVIKWINTGEMKFSSNCLNRYLHTCKRILSNDLSILDKYYHIPPFIRNLNVKRLDGKNEQMILQNASNVRLHEWNSKNILREIIPLRIGSIAIEDPSYECLTICNDTFTLENNQYMISCDLGFMPKFAESLEYFFKYNSTIPRYDTIPKKCVLPPIETFGKPRDKIYNLISYDFGQNHISNDEPIIYGTEYKIDEIVSYDEFIKDQCKFIKLRHYEKYDDSIRIWNCTGIKEKIIAYGEMCLPYDIF
jgi:hypothetical protein